MKKIHIINSGGTFNKIFDPREDDLVIEKKSKALEEISTKGFCSYEITNIEDHTNIELIKNKIITSKSDHIIIICDISIATLIAKDVDIVSQEKYIVFMDINIPYSIDPIAATAILCSVYGQLRVIQEQGVYIVKNGLIVKEER